MRLQAERGSASDSRHSMQVRVLAAWGGTDASAPTQEALACETCQTGPAWCGESACACNMGFPAAHLRDACLCRMALLLLLLLHVAVQGAGVVAVVKDHGCLLRHGIAGIATEKQGLQGITGGKGGAQIYASMAAT